MFQKITHTSVPYILPAIACVMFGAFLYYTLTPDTNAANRADWKAGNIISDAEFTNANGMSEGEIQTFLDKTVNGCDPKGQQRSEYDSRYTRAEYAARVGWPGPEYTCINMYYEVPKKVAGNFIPASNYGGKPIPSGAKSAAWIIKDAAVTYNINPKVLLVKLATESAGPLTADKWPLKYQYDFSMGAYCPDSGPGGSANCDPTYAGFSLQMYSSAKLLRSYLDGMDQSWWGCVENGKKVQCAQNRLNGPYPGESYKVPFTTNAILWNVKQRGCGAANVYLENKATTALYYYTPYQPNNAALNNMYGTGDNCSAYGNRNFWRVYWDWFGNTREPAKFENFSSPRRLTLNAATEKINANNSQPASSTLPSGMVRKFTSKVILPNGDLCFRTETDADQNLPLCVPAKYLSEITIEYSDVAMAEQYQQVKTTAYKVNLRENKRVSDHYEKTRQLIFTKKTTIEDIDYLISSYDVDNGSEVGVPASLVEQSYRFEPISPSLMRIKDPTYKRSVSKLEKIDGELPEYTARIFTSRAKVGNQWLYRTESDQSWVLGKAIPEADLLTNPIEPFSSPRCMVTTQPVKFFDSKLSEISSRMVPKNFTKLFTNKIMTEHNWYYQAALDPSTQEPLFISSSSLKDTPCYEDFSSPRELTLNRNQAKVNISDMSNETTFPRGMTRKYVSKVLVNNTWYFRTETDTDSNINLAFPASSLSEKH